MKASDKDLRRKLLDPINCELKKVLEQIGYDYPFVLSLSTHAMDRLHERVIGTSYSIRFGNMMRNIMTHGLCELLYVHRRYMMGDRFGAGSIEVELIFGDLVAPLSIMPEYVKIKTVLIQDEDKPRDAHIQIDVSNDRFKSLLSSVGRANR